MKDKTLTNKKLVSALMIGISAMITLQSPVTAYASGDVEPLPDNDGGTPDTTSEVAQQEVYDPVTDEAQAQAEVAQEAISNTAPEEAGTGAVEGAAQEAKEAADLILAVDAGEIPEGAQASESDTAVKELIEAANAIVTDGPQSDGIAPSAISDLGNASSKIEEVKNDLVQAEEANKQAESSYKDVQEESKEMVDSAKVMIDTADAMKEETQTADEKTAALVESIQDATTREDAEKAYQDLEKLVSDMKDDLAAKKKLYDQMVEDYEKAVLKLEQAQSALDAAEQRFDGKVSDAVQGTIVAEASVEEAQRKVDNLAEAIDKVEDKISDEAAATELSELRGSSEWKGSIGGVEKNRTIMREVIVNYYMPKILGIDIIAEEVNYQTDFEAVSGAEGQEYNYHKFTYKYRDENGEVKTGVKYFNWDSLIKLNLNSLGLNSGEGVVVFEKTEDEIAADTLVKEYYKNSGLLSNNKKKTAYSEGKFDVFMYTDSSGEKKYLVREQVENAVDSGTTVLNDDGTPASYDGYQLTQVIQNQNNLLHEGNCIIVASDKNIVKYTTQDTAVRNQIIRNSDGSNRLSEKKVDEIIKNSKALNTFIVQNSVAVNPNTSALMSQYAQYKEETLEAKAAAAKATEEVSKLADAIDNIKEQGKNKKSRMAVDVLGVSDVATSLGLTVSADEAARLNGMTIGALMQELNNLKAQADEKAAKAQAKATEVQTKFDNAAGVLGKTIARLTPPGGGGGGSGSAGRDGLALDEGADGEVTGAAGVRVYAGGSLVAASGAAAQGGVALENDAAGGTTGVALENNASGGTNGIALENAGAAGGNVEISDEMVALSDGISESDSRPTIVGNQSVVTKSEETVVTIEEEDTALSATAETGTIPQKKNWWWILIIAILGTAGEKMYKRHLEKKEARIKAEDDEWD